MKGYWLGLAVICPVFAQPPASFSVDVKLVRVPCSVTRPNGTPVQNLRKEDFIVLEDGKAQEVKYLWQELDLPITLVVVADVSCGSMGIFRSHPNQLAEEITQLFDRVLSSSDRAAIVAVTDQARLLTDLTGSIEKLRCGAANLRVVTDDKDRLGSEASGVRNAGGPILGVPCIGTNPTRWSGNPWPCGFAALWNGVYFSARLGLRPQKGPKAIVLFAPGLDTGSDRGLKDAVAECQQAGALVYSIRRAGRAFLDSAVDPTMAAEATPRGGIMEPPKTEATRSFAYFYAREKPDMEEIARDTGGLMFDGKDSKFAEICDRIQSDLRNQYVLAYTPATAHSTRTFHKLQVKLTSPGLKVRTQDGYYAQ